MTVQSHPPKYVVPLITASSQIGLFAAASAEHATLQVMPDDHSALAPPLPIPNRTVKRRRADDSAATSVKVGNRQACTQKRPRWKHRGRFALCDQFRMAA